MNEPAEQMDRPYLDFCGAKPLPLASVVDMPAIPMRRADVSLVLDCCCQSYLVTRGEISSADRHKTVMEARVVAYWLLRTLTKASSTEIGIALAKDHSSALTGARRCEQRRERDPEFRAFTDELTAAVKARLGRLAP